MQTATGETTWPVMGNIKWHGTYYAMVATPLAVADVVAAQLVFVMFRIATTVGGVPAGDGPVRRLRVGGRRAAGLAGAGARRDELRRPVLRLLRHHQERGVVRDHLPPAGHPAVPVLRRVLPDLEPLAAAGVAGPAHAAVARRGPHPDARARARSGPVWPWCTSATCSCSPSSAGGSPSCASTSGWRSRSPWPSSPPPSPTPPPPRARRAGRSSGATSPSTSPAGWCS